MIAGNSPTKCVTFACHVAPFGELAKFLPHELDGNTGLEAFAATYN
jgi:hypothetical protein